ncbi:MAG: hypothetical protein OEZ04_05430 [Nitrospinota bacterium]|nr:hypothetical protein [Nitrospinota bacterium]
MDGKVMASSNSGERVRFGIGFSMAAALSLFVLTGAPCVGQVADITFEAGGNALSIETPVTNNGESIQNYEEDENGVELSSNTIAINSMALLIGMVSLEYQHVINDNLSFTLRGHYWSWSLSGSTYKYVGGGIGLRYYLANHAPTGWHFALNLDTEVGEKKTESNKYESESFPITPNMMVGYSLLLGKFYMYFGVGMSYWSEEGFKGREKINLIRIRKGFFPSLGFNVGFAF